ncbi:MAG TPA: TerB family tellurite resistance protein [Flavobacterium sp.]|uniref:TerB family tellurite resistance protein n=1 Tax=Flavobacterium sp. TaxID=239 RepID=UPI002DBB6EDC|nr:TerB family tellurite resistance protein [Flavobacterium sp.]HEU4789420.1 TerB family tellurite resistance protein [Flavobacterium sp.]
MKKIKILVILLMMLLTPVKAVAQYQEMQQLLLNIEKLAQFKQILSDMKKGYEILNGGYKAVKDMTQGNFTLHKTFLDALMQVSPVVKKYKRVGDIINYQIMMIKESKIAFKRFSNSKSFSQKEIEYFEKVYGNLVRESLRNLDELAMVITANKLRMSDDERLKVIDAIYLEMQDKLQFLRNFNASSDILALQRAKEHNDVNVLRGIYELNN